MGLGTGKPLHNMGLIADASRPNMGSGAGASLTQCGVGYECAFD